MKTPNETKGIVQKMRSIRDKLSSDITNMTLEQEKEFIRTQLSVLKSKS